MLEGPFLFYVPFPVPFYVARVPGKRPRGLFLSPRFFLPFFDFSRFPLSSRCATVAGGFLRLPDACGGECACSRGGAVVYAGSVYRGGALAARRVVSVPAHGHRPEGSPQDGGPGGGFPVRRLRRGSARMERFVARVWKYF